MDRATKGWRLTNRGRLVIVLIVISLCYWAMSATTPDECKVPVQEMSQGCIDLMFP